MSKILAMMFAGALGAISRYVVSGWIQERVGGVFPWGTMTVNVLGCFIFGFIWTLANERYLLPNSVSFVVLTGFAGAFTTFSTMTFEGLSLASTSAVALAVGYLLGSQLLGMGAIWSGAVVARML